MIISQQLKILVNDLGDSSISFAKRTGVNKDAILRCISGKSKPSVEFVEKILLAIPGLNGNWLVAGEGEMWKEGYDLGMYVTQKGQHNYQQVNTGSIVGKAEEAPGEYKTENEHLKELLEEKDRIIKGQEDLIAEKERLIRILMEGRE